MMHLFLDGLGASSSSGLTYLRNVVPHLSAQPGLRTTVVVSPQLQEELGSLPNISFAEISFPASVSRRFWFEQANLPAVIRRSAADVLISAGNFALRHSPVPQILLSGNSLYTSSDFFRDLRRRRAYGIWWDTKIKAVLAKRSVRWADCTVAPSQTFAEELRRWTGGRVVRIYHGFDPEVFLRETEPLPQNVRQKIDSAHDALRLLFVSHYNYYRNFETLFRAIPLLRARLGTRQVRLFLTCKLHSADNPGSYRAEGAAELVRQLGIAAGVVELGTVPYRLLHQVYKACQVYVTPAYAETFAHPVVEAMANGLPVVASDLPVHREICASAAHYFPRFSPEELANQIALVAGNPELSAQLSANGRQRACDFSWEKHVRQVVDLAARLKVGQVTELPAYA